MKFADVVSRNDGIIMMILLGRGRNEVMYPPMMIFQSKDSSYPIKGLHDDVPGAYYRTGPKVWMGRSVL